MDINNLLKHKKYVLRKVVLKYYDLPDEDGSSNSPPVEISSDSLCTPMSGIPISTVSPILGDLPLSVEP